jgi:polysaccharide deacetylase 2 family uncharacterized protein YibQ
VLFGLGLGCIVTAGALWLFGPEPAPAPAAASRPAVTPAAVAAVPGTTTAPPDAAGAGPTPERDVAPATPSLAPATATPLAAATAEPTLAPSPAGEATPAGKADGRPRLAIIIDDCGQWPTTERAFVALDFPVTLSVLPHVRYGPAIAREADAAGKGVMLHLPMQTVSGRYPGPGTITVKMPDDAIRSEVEGDLAELPEARGVNNHEGSLATADRRVMGDVADVLVRENRFWIDSKTSAASIAASVTRDRGIPTASRDVFLDDVDNEAAVESQLREAAARARADGTAIAIGHPREATLLAVRTLGPELMADGIDLTLASDLVH